MPQASGTPTTGERRPRVINLPAELLDRIKVILEAAEHCGNSEEVRDILGIVECLKWEAQQATN